MNILQRIWKEAILGFENCHTCGAYVKTVIFSEECERCWFAPNGFWDFKEARNAGKITTKDLIKIREKLYAQKAKVKEDKLNELQKRASEILSKELKNGR